MRNIFEIRKRIAGTEGYDVLSITQRGIRIRDTESNDGQLASSYANYQIVEPGDFAMNHMDLLTGWVDCSRQLGVTSPDYRVFALREEERVCPRFALYLLQNGYTQKVFFAFGQGSSHLGRWRLPTDAFLNFIAPLPSRSEQTAIAAFLDRETAKIDALVEEQRRLIELLKEKRQAVISRAVTKGLDPTVAMKDSGVEWLGDIPAHWKACKLGHHAKLQSGFAFSAADFGNVGVPVVRMNNLDRGHLDLSAAACIPVDKANERVALRKGDLVWGMSGSIGETGSLGNFARVKRRDLPCQLNQRVGRLLPFDTLTTDYLELLIQSDTFQKQVLLFVTGTAQFNVSAEQVHSIAIAVPPNSEQLQVVEIVNEKINHYRKLFEEAQRSIDLLHERRAALISAAVTGKIDVCHGADDQVEAV